MASAGTCLWVFLLLLMTMACQAHWGWWNPGPEEAPVPKPAKDLVLSSSYYSKTCPQVTSIVKKAVDEILKKNRNIAGGFQRLHFHDCWVNGCDGSILLNSTATNTAERDGFTNFLIRGIPEIDEIKLAVEKACPNTVSCADIVALAARDATVKVGGLSWPVGLGRKDSLVSLATDADSNLPFPVLNFTGLVENFARKGFNAREMIVLSGSHTIGRTHCNGIQPNLYNFTGIEDLTNPALDPKFAKTLKNKCPKGNRTNIVAMDRTKNLFDREYFKAVLQGRGVFITDMALIEDSFGRGVVQELVQPGSSFFREFAQAMAKMSKLSPPEGAVGQIRKHCQFVN